MAHLTRIGLGPEGYKIHYALRFRFPTSNNKAEYDTLIAGLHLAKELQVHNLRVYSDSQLVENQVNDIYQARGKKMVAYLEKAKGLMKAIQAVKVHLRLPKC